jgi:hypothetical protein
MLGARPTMDASSAPLASSSLAALRLLVGYALAAEETASARGALLARSGAARAPACPALMAVLGAVREGESGCRTLDAVLAAALGGEADRYARLSARALACRWREQGHDLAGPDLAALLWQVARRAEHTCRELENDIARACSPLRLLSAQQLAVDPVYHESVPRRCRCPVAAHADIR